MADACLLFHTLAGASAKTALLLTAAWALTLVLRRSSAAVRHVVWSVALAGALLLPLLSFALPARPLHMLPPAAETSGSAQAGAMNAATATHPGLSSGFSSPAASPAETEAMQSAAPAPAESVEAREPAYSPPPSPASRSPHVSPMSRPPWAVPVLVVWLLGALAAVAPLLLGWWRVERLSREAQLLDDSETSVLLARACEQLSLRPRVALLRSRGRVPPMVWGLWRPNLLLPAEAVAWPREQLHLVLIHELAHVRRGDCISQLVAHLACACYWFNPLAWLALRRLHDEQQRACDDLVLAASVRPSDYAESLLEITRGLDRPALVCAAAVAMARQSTMGARISAILDEKRSRRRATRRVVLAAALCALAILIPLSQLQALPAAALLVPGGKGPDGQALYAWEPGQSSRGGEQYDPRLDTPMTCWRAGISLSDLFAVIADQTGVSIGFWPPDDQNARVRVNLFLNPDDPPALGDLMAQLSWVTDCTFGCTGSEDKTRYYLLSTSVAQSAASGLQQREAEARQRCTALLQALKDRNAQLREALELPREEAIDLYQGKDDALLLTLLDPVRRAAAQIASKHLPRLLGIIQFDPALPPGRTQSFGTGIGLVSLSQDERDAVETAFPTWDVDYDDPEVSCLLIVDSTGGVQLGPPHYRHDPLESWIPAMMTVMDVSNDIQSRPEDEIALRRALGETISPEDESAYVARRKAEVAAAEKQREEQRRAAGRYLSNEMRETLASTALPLATGSYPAWRVEEEVARATGMHIVADALLDATADIPKSPDRAGNLAALRAVEAFCAAPGRSFMRTPEWEWGDAGPFLTFRTSNRDVWRASMLPRALLDWLDKQIEPYLPRAKDQGKRPTAAEFDLPVEPEHWARWLSSLTELQTQHGALVPCGEPDDLLDAARRSTWKAAFALAEQEPAMFRFLGRLNSPQWESARTGNLRAPRDLMDDQMKLLTTAIDEKSGWALHLPEDSSLAISITQGPCESDEFRRHVIHDEAGNLDSGGAGGGVTYPENIAGPGDWYRVNITAKGRLEGEDEETTVLEKQVPFLPTAIHVSVGAPRVDGPG